MDDTTFSRSRDLTSAEALDAAFAGAPCELLCSDGRVKGFPAHRWTGPASPAEVALFVDPCSGATLDVGCGPGRLTVAVTRRGFYALGVDISGEAVRLTRKGGAPALHQDVFDDLPDRSQWRHIILADGNVGMGGDPVRLLRRLVPLLGAGGTMLVEVAGPGILGGRDRVRLRVGGVATEPFDWATVGLDDIEHVAALAGMAVSGVRTLSGRYVATLVNRP
jgi:SAM-dependent methyltransferase